MLLTHLLAYLLKAVELYNHTAPLPKGASTFDAYENVNLAPRADPALLRRLSAKLRAEFALHPDPHP